MIYALAVIIRVDVVMYGTCSSQCMLAMQRTHATLGVAEYDSLVGDAFIISVENGTAVVDNISIQAALSLSLSQLRA